MAGGLFFDASDGWFVSGWIFERLLLRAKEVAESDTELVAVLDRGLLHNGLVFSRVDPALAGRVTLLIKQVTTSELRRDHDDLKPSDVEMYRRALSTLLEVLAKR